MNIYTALPFIALANYFLGSYIGRYIERKKWNKKISEGLLPKPGRRWMYIDRLGYGE
jgi:hypothetical protein